MRLLALQLVEALETVSGERAVLNGCLHRAPRLALVLAVGEVAVRRELRDVVERLADPGVGRPELKLAHAWCVDQQGAAWKRNQLPMRRGVPPAVIAVADLASREPLLAQEAIDQGGLPHPRRSEHSDRLAGLKIWRKRLEPGIGAGTHHVNRHAQPGASGLEPPGVDLVAQIGLVEQDYRTSPALQRHREVAL